jgi:hypothetical protein
MFNRQPYNRGKYNVTSGGEGMIGLPIVVSLSADNAQLNNAVGLSGGTEIVIIGGSAELKSNMLTAEPLNISLDINNAVLLKNLTLTAQPIMITLSASGLLSIYQKVPAGPLAIKISHADSIIRRWERIMAKPSVIKISAAAAINVKRNLEGNCPIIITGSADLDFWISELIALSGITLAPGKVLVIDTEKMTVTVDGVNAMSKLSNSSSFFNLKPGNNSIVYTGGQPAEMRILWKDRYL